MPIDCKTIFSLMLTYNIEVQHFLVFKMLHAQQVTGMLLELPIPSVTQLLADRELLAEAVTKSREEYLNFIQVIYGRSCMSSTGSFFMVQRWSHSKPRNPEFNPSADWRCWTWGFLLLKIDTNESQKMVHGMSWLHFIGQCLSIKKVAVKISKSLSPQIYASQ